MIPKEAIEKAIEGGGYADSNDPEWDWHMNEFQNRAALDPSFWQSLAIALEWADFTTIVYGGVLLNTDGSVEEDREVHRRERTWLHYSNRFHGLILTGGDTTAFWKGLLT